jgi:hypothetical protein
LGCPDGLSGVQILEEAGVRELEVGRRSVVGHGIAADAAGGRVEAVATAVEVDPTAAVETVVDVVEGTSGIGLNDHCGVVELDGRRLFHLNVGSSLAIRLSSRTSSSLL